MVKVVLLLVAFASISQGQEIALITTETLSTIVAGDTVTIFNYGAQENCASRFSIDFQTNGMLVTMTERDTVKAKANCICNFDLSASRTGFPIGTYGVMVYREYLKLYNYPKETLVFIGSTSFIVTSFAGGSQYTNAKQSECYQTSAVRSNRSVPAKMELEIFPNPSSASFTIRYLLRHSDNVLLRLFDALGKNIMTLVDEKMNAGVYEVNLPIDKMISVGVYYCTLVAPSSDKLMKLIVIR